MNYFDMIYDTHRIILLNMMTKIICKRALTEKSGLGWKPD